MIKVFILDDEPSACIILQSLVEKLCDGVDIRTETSPNAAVPIIEDFRPDILFLDIEMHNQSGFDVLNQVSVPAMQVIFTTAFEKYAIKAIKFSALDYLLKPIDRFELEAAINRYYNQKEYLHQQTILHHNLYENILTKDESKFKLALSIKEGVFLFDPVNIIYLEAQSNYTKFYFDNHKSLLVSKTLKEYDEILGTCGFIRTHKSYLVNRIHMIKMGSDDILHLTGELKVDVSRRAKPQINEVFKKN